MKVRPRSLVAAFVLLLVLLFGLLIQPVGAQSASIVLDGLFDDWAGQPCVTDPLDDAKDSTDILTFCFVSDQSVGNLYFMVERQKETNKPLNFTIRLDINDNGSYSDAQDRLIQVTYNPNENTSNVTVAVLDGSGSLISTVASNANWGEIGSTGAAMVELYVPISALGIAPGSTAAVTMDVISFQGSSVADGLDIPVQWTPADALGWGLLLFILICASMYMAFRKRETG